MWTRRIHEPFITAALLIALTAGFGYAALLVAALALKYPLGTWWGAAVQAHGHAQLFGWMGLFIIGMGLYFLPKLRGTKLKQTQYAPWACALLAAGLVLHSIAQPTLGFLEPGSGWQYPLRAIWAASVVMEFAGIVLIARMLVETEFGGGKLSREAPVYPVLPLLRLAAASTGAAFLFNSVGTLLAVYRGDTTIAPEWDSLVIQLMLYGLAIPMAFAFSVRNLPLFLRLAMPPREPVRYLGFAYAIGLVLRLAPDAATIANLHPTWLDPVGAVGGFVQGCVILAFVWTIDLLRRRLPWTTFRAPNTRPDLDYLRRPTRKDYPDAGEYGRFELVLYSAFTWLVFAVVLGFVRSIGALLGNGGWIPADAERHALTVGFVTMLIFGMGARLVPGFSGKRRLALPWLVSATFVLGNLAALLRTVPLLFPTTPLLLALLGSSGAIGWLGVAALAFNLGRTVRT